MKDSPPPDYSQHIRELRTRFGLTQQSMAELMGVSFASVNRWENGKTRPSSLAWQRITRAEILGIEALTKDYVIDTKSKFSVSEEKVQYGIVTEETHILDFSTPAEIVRIVAEGERLAYGHLFNPSFATETSLIDPLPHQSIAVYEHMLKQPRLRFLLADDAGAGKTIMAGLYIREMLARRLIQRILVVPPAGLISNWDREMHYLFNLPFQVISGSDAMGTTNPFCGQDSNLLIVSIDTLAGERMFSRLQDPDVIPYDLVIFDEAHKLSADREPDFRMRKTDRYRLAESIAGVWIENQRWQLPWNTQHILLLTATPHMGKDYPYYCLWRLLEPEILPTIEAFNSYPRDARQHHFIRRTKEEMVRFDGSQIYPTRISDTLSYDLTQGSISEQKLYDETTNYIDHYYNRARILNRSAARLAMSIFQRRLASSTHALLRTFERRLEKLDQLILDIRSGKIDSNQLIAYQKRLELIQAPLDEMTADEEFVEEGREQNEIAEELILGGVVAVSLADLETERIQVQEILELAKKVYLQGQESKFERLCKVIDSPEFQNVKMIIFTEHKDTLNFLVRRLEGIGFAGQIAKIHGGVGTKPNVSTGLSERDEQVEFFRKNQNDGGARFLVATDAAGEGINLQFCWLMINYDIPWNPARLEQRMGRIHRYKQMHDPVIILNLVAGKTREGRVLKTLLDKLERIRRELGSDKVFDVVGRLFEGVSLRLYMEKVISKQGVEEVVKEIEGKLTKEQIQAIQEREKSLFGDGGDIHRELPRLRANLSKESYQRLLPGYVRRFIEKAAPMVDIGIEGNLGSYFSLRPLKPGALDPIWLVLEAYPSERRDQLTVYKPDDGKESIFLHPGEPLFDHLRSYICSRFAEQACRGGIFIDPVADAPYLFHLALVHVFRKADPSFPYLTREEFIDYRLVGIRQDATGEIRESPIEALLLLKDGDGYGGSAVSLIVNANTFCEQASTYAYEQISRQMVEAKRESLFLDLSEREDFLRRGYDLQYAELAAARTRYRQKARKGDRRAKAELSKIKARQRRLAQQREIAIATLHREPELITPGEVEFLTHTLVIPSTDPEDRKRHDAEVEAVAVRMAWAYEDSLGAKVIDVSTPKLSRAAGLGDHPGFDLLSRRSNGEELAIEVKGRARIGDIDVSENEWAKACNLRERYWLYVVFDCATSQPGLFRVQDPFGKLLIRMRGGVIVDEKEIFNAASLDN